MTGTMSIKVVGSGAERTDSVYLRVTDAPPLPAGPPFAGHMLTPHRLTLSFSRWDDVEIIVAGVDGKVHARSGRNHDARRQLSSSDGTVPADWPEWIRDAVAAHRPRPAAASREPLAEGVTAAVLEQHLANLDDLIDELGSPRYGGPVAERLARALHAAGYRLTAVKEGGV